MTARVLVIDDEPDVLKAYGRLLRSAGFDVQLSGNAGHALGLLSTESFDVVLSDIRMPGLDGLEFLRAVRDHDLELPVILMTGAPEVDGAMQAVEYGALRYLAKPIETEDLIEAARKGAAIHTLAKLRRKALESTGLGLQLGDHASLEARFERALDRLWMAFQPIVRAPLGSIFGYEALVRADEPSLPHPGALLDAASRLDQLQELGRRIRQRVAEAAPDAPSDLALFVNVNSVDLRDDELYSSNGSLAPLANRIVLEMTERESLHQVPELAAKVRALREMGFRLAVDDLGAGYAGLSSFTALDPEIVKIDMSLVRDIHLSDKKRSVVRGIAKVCREELNTSVVCEGVEVGPERDVLVEDGVDLLQGYLFGKPQAGFAAASS